MHTLYILEPKTTELVIGGSVFFVILLGLLVVFLLIKFVKSNQDHELRKLQKDFRKGDKSTKPEGNGRGRHLALPWTGEYEIEEKDWSWTENTSNQLIRCSNLQ